MNIISDSFRCAIKYKNVLYNPKNKYVYYIGKKIRIYKNLNHNEIYLDNSSKLYICKNQYYKDFNNNHVMLIHFKLITLDNIKWCIEEEECNCYYENK